MGKAIIQKKEKLNREHSQKRRRRIVLLALAAAVVFGTVYALMKPASTWEFKLECKQKEHIHTEECYAEVPVKQEQKCLVCRAQEHTHSDGCYEEATSYVCGLENDETHIHTADCEVVQKRLVCDQEEHTHGDSCYEVSPAVTKRQLVCTEEEHTHTDDCYNTPPRYDEGYYCGYIAHTHSDYCYFSDGTLRCTLPEHKHILACKSNPDADTESESEWKATFAAVTLSDSWADNVVAIAESQLGYRESKDNFRVAGKDETNGYTRYGAWYGDPYGDWCAMFASFCIDYAGVKNFPLDSSCGSWIAALSDENVGRYYAADTYTPRPGDLVFFDWDAAVHVKEASVAAERADHVGIVCQWQEASGNKPAQITTVEGNMGDCVCCRAYNADDIKILGYGALPQDPTHQTLSFAGEDFRVQVFYTQETGIPEDAQLHVRELLPDSEEYRTYYTEMVDGVSDNSIKFCRLFDISFMVDGKEVEPLSPVNVRITYDDALPYDAQSDTCQTVHFAENTTEKLPTEIADGEDGKHTFVFTQSSFSVVANLLMSTTSETGTYYQRVNQIDSSSANYLIVSAEGNYALTYGNSPYSTKIKLTPVKGNPGYYTVDNVNNAMRWRFNGSSVQNVESASAYLRLANGQLFGDARSMTRTYSNVGGTWQIAYRTNYLRNNGGTFSHSNSGNYESHMLILKEVSATLRIPDDVTGGNDPEHESGGEKTQPVYTPDTAAISGAKKGDVADITAIVPDADKHIIGSYASDPSTSQIEDRFFSVPTDGQNPTQNDGKLLTDKSVIYKGDDYGAFGSYDDDTFGVTLSVLGQDYRMKEADQVKIPVDVVFVLDVSGSMGNRAGNAAGNMTRREAVVNAVNATMTQIMNDNPENRAGVVLYSSGGSTLLDLDHYTAGDNHQYLNYNSDKIRTAKNLKGVKADTVEQTFGEVGGFTQEHGTYTQYGIALGAKLLESNTDTTYTTTLHQGTDDERKVTVKRQPVMILLSDGDPTHCTANYTDVLSGPAYGDGVYPSTANNKGVQGYYTILSANYYKRAVGIHYDTPAMFYTVGMGIYDGDSANKYKDMSGASSTGDCYKRAVLNPTTANVNDLMSYGARDTDPNNRYSAAATWSISCQMLNQLLGNTYGEQTVKVGETTSYHAAIGATNAVVPVLDNPYSDSYSYANGAYFGDLSGKDLQKIFHEIISGNLNIKRVGYMLSEGTRAVITDEIGEGMELKGTPVLRYNGKFYPLTQEVGADGIYYVCHAVATTADGSSVSGGQRTADLSEIEIKVTTVNGRQTVTMELPDTVLPTYTPELTADWYYEELPVRLIYQVGLTDNAKNAVQSLQPEQTLTYYTNAWSGTAAQSTHKPHRDNPYYHDVTYDDGTSRTRQYKDFAHSKSENTTATADTSVNSKEVSSVIKATLGNNGKLVFRNTAPPAVPLTLRKVDMLGNTVTSCAAEFALYSDEALRHQIGTYTTVNGVVTIPKLKINQTYYLKETKAPDGYYPMPDAKAFSVDADGKVNGIDGDAYLSWEKGELLVHNPDGYVFPKTGGAGVYLYTCGGIVLLAVPVLYGYSVRRKRERGNN